jgi:hypothetical protein
VKVIYSQSAVTSPSSKDVRAGEAHKSDPRREAGTRWGWGKLFAVNMILRTFTCSMVGAVRMLTGTGICNQSIEQNSYFGLTVLGQVRPMGTRLPLAMICHIANSIGHLASVPERLSISLAIKELTHLHCLSTGS